MQRQAHEDRPGNSEDSQRIAGTTRPGKVEVRPAFACPVANKGSKQTPFEVRTPKNIKKNFFALERPSEPTRNFIFALKRPSGQRKILFSHWNDPQDNEKIYFRVGTTLRTNEKFYFRVGTTLRTNEKIYFRVGTTLRPMKKFIFALIVSPRTSNFVVSCCEM